MAGDNQRIGRIEEPGKGEAHEGCRENEIGGTHEAEQIARADAVADDAEQRREQRADELQRAVKGEQHHRAGLDDDIPAEDDAFHLARPGGEQIGRPLKAEARDRERSACEDGSACHSREGRVRRVSNAEALPCRRCFAQAWRDNPIEPGVA